MDYYDLSFFSVLFCSVKKKKNIWGTCKNPALEVEFIFVDG